MNILTIDKLWKKTETKFELKDITIAIYEKEWLLFTGPVNEGKEALQQILLGFDQDWQGSIYINNKNIEGINDYSKQIAFIHNHIVEEEIDHLVFDYLAFPLRLNGLDEVEIYKQIEHLVKETDLDISLQVPVNKLSLKAKIETVFLRAVINKPKLIVIEEPFLGLPNSQREMVISGFRQFKKSRNCCPVIIFSSYASEWFDICDRIALINQHSIVQTGSKTELLRCPKNIFVSNYIDSEAISFLKGRITSSSFLTEGLILSLPPSLRNNLKIYKGQTVYVGLKSESFRLLSRRKGNDEEFTLLLPIHFTSKDNGIVKIYSNLGGQPLVAEIKNHGKIYESNEVQLYYSFNDLLFFDGVTKTILIREKVGY